MEDKNMLRKIRIRMIISVIISVACLVGGIALWETYDYWWAMVIGWAVFIATNAWLVIFYHKNISYKCPNCGHVFKPSYWRFLISAHMPTKRRLKCPKCNQKSWCKEVYIDKTTDNE